MAAIADGSGGPKARVGRYLASGRAAFQEGRLGESRLAYLEAAREADAAGDRRSLVAAALGIGGLWVYEQRNFLERIALEKLWSDARALVEKGSLDEARLEARLAAEAVYEGGPVDRVEKAVERVKQFGDPRATAETLSLLHHCCLGPAHADTRIGIAEEIVRQAAWGDDEVLGVMGLCWRTVDLYLLGDRRAEQSLQEFKERSGGNGALSFIADLLAAMRVARSGRLPEAERAAEGACERGVAAGDPDAMAYFGALLSTLRWWQGRGLEIAESVRELASSPLLSVSSHVYVAANAVLSATIDDIDTAQEALAVLASEGLDSLPHNSSWLTTQFLVAEAAFLLGDANVASQVSPLMRPYAHLPVMPSVAVVCLGSAKRALGLAAATCGDMDAAVAWMEEALTETQRLGNRPMTAMTGHTLAQLLEARGHDSDKRRVATLYAQATERADRIGVVLPAAPAWLGQDRTKRRRAYLVRQPPGWRLEVDGRTSFVGESIGVGYLAALLENPRKDCHVLELANTEGPARSGQNPQPLLDAHALRSYRARIKELSAAMDSSGNSLQGAGKTRREIEEIRRLLRTSTSLGGSARDFPTDQERARTAVRKALVRALRAISESEPELGETLQEAVTTGIVCRFDPPAGWSVEVTK